MGKADRTEVAEEALARAERYYRNLIEHSLGLICAHDLEGNLLFINPAAAHSLGYEPEDARGAHLRTFLAPSTRDLFGAYLDRIRRHGVDAGLMRLVASDGRERVWMYRNILYDEPPEPPHVLGHAIDITDRIQIEQDLRESQHALTRTLGELDARVHDRTLELERANERLHAEIAERQRAEEMRELVLARERENLAFWTRVSKELAAILDYEATLRKVARLPVPFLADWSLLHVVGEPGTCRCVAGTHVDPDRHQVLERLAALAPAQVDPNTCLGRVLTSARTETVSFPAIASTREWFGDDEHGKLIEALGAHAVIVTPVVCDGHVLGALSLVSVTPGDGRFVHIEPAMLDVLGRRFAAAIDRARLYKQAHEANRLKDEFLATLSHELRTPLQAVIGWARILRCRQLDERSDHAADVIERNAFTLARMVDDILDVSRIVTGKLTLEQRSVDMSVVLGAALDTIRPAARAKEITLEHQIEQTASVLGDEHRLQQVVWNLLSNAVKFTRAGGTVTVSLRQAGSILNLVVSDTGVGIRRDLMPFVFDRFRQGDASTTRIQSGLGLGLAIVRHIVELHGGSVRVESVEGRGSTFIVELPAVGSITDVEAGTGVAPAAVDSAEILRDTRVLVVDDEADAREWVAETVRRAGGIAMTAGSTREALEAVTMFDPDVLLADLGLPWEDGYELVRRIREQRRERLRPMVAIALTGYSRAEDRSRALAAGFREHVPKPVEPHRLVSIVRRILDEGSESSTLTPRGKQ